MAASRELSERQSSAAARVTPTGRRAKHAYRQRNGIDDPDIDRGQRPSAARQRTFRIDDAPGGVERSTYPLVLVSSDPAGDAVNAGSLTGIPFRSMDHDGARSSSSLLLRGDKRARSATGFSHRDTLQAISLRQARQCRDENAGGDHAFR